MKTFMVVGVLMLMGVHASADCGWVLWTHRTYPDKTQTWDIERAFPNFEQCEAELTKAVERILKPSLAGLKPERLPDGRSVLMFSTDNTIFMSIFFMCLPGTLDPRPR